MLSTESFNIPIILLYSTTIVVTIALKSILIRFLKKKSLQILQVRDSILSDLAVMSGAFVVAVSSLALVRELLGPVMSLAFVSTAFMLLQYLYTMMLSCIVSLQSVQVLWVLRPELLSDFRDEKLVLFHRLFVLVAGLSGGGVVCHFNGGLCRPIPLFHHIVGPVEVPQPHDTVVQPVMLVIFIIIISSFQAAVEIKRYQLTKMEVTSHELAVSAAKELEKAIRDKYYNTFLAALRALFIFGAGLGTHSLNFDQCDQIGRFIAIWALESI